MNVCMQLHDGGALDSPRANFPRGTVKLSEAAVGSNPRESARSPLCLLGVLTRFLREHAAAVLTTVPRLSFGMIPNGKKKKKIHRMRAAHTVLSHF